MQIEVTEGSFEWALNMMRFGRCVRPVGAPFRLKLIYKDRKMRRGNYAIDTEVFGPV